MLVEIVAPAAAAAAVLVALGGAAAAAVWWQRLASSPAYLSAKMRLVLDNSSEDNHTLVYSEDGPTFVVVVAVVVVVAIEVASEVVFVTEVVFGLELELESGEMIADFVSADFVSAEVVVVSVAGAEAFGLEVGVFVAEPEPSAYAETDSARLLSRQRVDPEVVVEVFVA